MNLATSLILGIVQGLTEFLPISSSGHLVITENILPTIKTSGVLFEVFLHAGTLLAVLIYFRKEILNITPKYLLYIIIGTIPAGAVGFMFQNSIEGLFSSVKLVGLFLMITGLINYLTHKLPKPKKSANVTLKQAILIGIAQSIAIIPGISRSGSTIFAGSKLGLSKKDAAKFSFVLSIPAILGANAMQFAKYGIGGEIEPTYFIVGFLASFTSGYFAIYWLFKLLNSNRYNLFTYYCIIVGGIVLLLL